MLQGCLCCGSDEDGLTYTRLTKGKGYTLKDKGALPPDGVVVPTAGDSSAVRVLG